MIAQLLELKLSGFRCFPTETTIPLDANVVLIHGTNGTGKTSVLSALEYALTGRVEELAAFNSDYPRCLKHVHSEGPAKATVRFLTHDQEEGAASHQTDISPTLAVTREDVRFFRDRCYLSQSSLGRLLENYQASSKDDPEQPLVRFVRELLGLDLLENLTAGLHEAGNITRIEKSVPALAKAREEQSILNVKIQGLNAELPVRSTAWQQALANCQRVVAEAGDPLPNEPWTLQGIANRFEAHAQSARASSGVIQQLRNAEGRVQRALGVLNVESSLPSLVKLQEQIKTISKRQHALEESVSGLLERAESLIGRLGQQTSEGGDVAARLNAIDAGLAIFMKRRMAQDDALAQAVTEVTRLRDRQTVLAKELTEFEPVQDGAASISQRWAAVLASVLEHLKGEDCPVCGRDYSELSRGDLRKHIVDEIGRVGADAKRMEERARRREQLAAENATISRQLSAIETQLNTDRERQVKERSEQPDVDKIAVEIAALSPLRKEWLENITANSTARNGLAAAEAHERQRAEEAAALEEISKTLKLPDEVRRPDPRAFAVSAAEFIAKRVEAAEKQAANANRMRESLEQTKAAGEAWQKNEREVAECVRRQRKAQAVETRLNADLKSARDLSKAATRAKTRLLEQVFNEKLNKLWRDLFIRLVKGEQFHPCLADPKTVRGSIRTTIEARREGVAPFEQFAAVASSGNLNTAALSLFLSLNLIEQPRHRFLVLDDPVQAMDDLHVVQLANLLREIRRQGKRQLILAVHERALFDYLCLQLGPTDPHTSLIGIELGRITRTHTPEVGVTRHYWKPDKVQFGS